MDDDDKARLARQGLKAAELMEPGKLSGAIGSSVSGAAKGVALKGIAAIGRLAGGGAGTAQHPGQLRARDDEGVEDLLDASDAIDFHAQLQAAEARRAQQQALQSMSMAELRKSFPDDAKQLALLLFNCMELLEEVAGGGRSMSAQERARKEELLGRIAKLLAPNAGVALLSFVDHVVRTSQNARR